MSTAQRSWLSLFIFVSGLALLIWLGPPAIARAAPVYPDKLYQEGMDAMTRRDYEAAIDLLAAAAALNPTAANHKELGEAYRLAGRYEEAADSFQRAADVYQRLGLVDDAEIYRQKAAGLRTKLELYMATEAGDTTQLYTVAKYEPRTGAYLGAFIDQDPAVYKPGGYVQVDFDLFNKLTGKKHSVFFTYVRYGESFPKRWVEAVAATGASVHLAWEPDNLDQVTDDAYLNEWARAAGASEAPVFLRFASEMNGNWTGYYGNPEKYINRFRLIHDVMARYAPNVALVWTPNAVPAKNIDDYYPGDAYVDWVGVNFYSVAYHNGDLNQPAFDEDPTLYLDYIYQRYADRKPIQVAEYGATHQASLAPLEDLTSFAIKKIRQLYTALPRRYPRVKAIHWYNSNNLTNPWTAPERRDNNFSLTENASVLVAYGKVSADPYYLSNVETGITAEISYQKLPPEFRLEKSVALSAWAQTYTPDYIISYVVDGLVKPAALEQPFSMTLNPDNFPDGWHTLEARVVDESGKTAGRGIYRFLVGEATGIVLELDSTVAEVNGQTKSLPAAPREIEGTTLVPFRFVGEALGAKVSWEAAEQKVVFLLGTQEVELFIGRAEARVNGEWRTLLQAPRLLDNSTLVPVRFVSETLGRQVNWDPTTRSITIR